MVTSINGNEIQDADIRSFFNTVGATLITFSTSFNPASYSRGGWTRVSGRFLYASTTGGGQTGGSTTHTHKYAIRYQPYYGAPVGEDNGLILIKNYVGSTEWPSSVKVSENVGNIAANPGLLESSGQRNPSQYVSEAQTEEVSAIPPYIQCYVWRRIS